MKTVSAILVALALVSPALAAPEGWSRPNGYFDQTNGGTLAKQSSHPGRDLCDTPDSHLDSYNRGVKASIC